VASTTTDPGGNYQLTVNFLSTIGTSGFQIKVGFLPYDYATAEGPTADSDIDMYGFTAPFALAAGAQVQKKAGLASMNVTTTDDDPNGAIAGKITLRDAIKTGNAGNFPVLPQGSTPDVTFYSAPGTPVSGTITLKAALPALEKSYDIVGPGASTLIVNGNWDAGTVFTVNGGVTSAISGLTVQGGSSADGGGVLNNGNLTLRNDIIGNGGMKNQVTGDGGGVFNASRAELELQTTQIIDNTAEGRGGGLMNLGTVTIYNGVKIDFNTSGNGGAGISNASGASLSAQSYVEIDGNTDTSSTGGGGVENRNGRFQILDGGEISYNKSAGNGGGVFNTGVTMTLQGVQLGVDTAAVRGGGVFVSTGSVTLTDVLIGAKNKAIEGGGMAVLGGTVKMSGGGITQNTALFTGRTGGGRLASGGGGGLFVAGGNVTLTRGVSINSNWSNFDGGGVFNSTGGTLTLNDNINIGSNHANDQGGGMYFDGTAPPSTTNFNGVTVDGNVALAIAGGATPAQASTNRSGPL
jgi:hypothetical protein